MRNPEEMGNDEGGGLDDVACAPESGQVPGGREDLWEEDADPTAHAFPPSPHESPKDEL